MSGDRGIDKIRLKYLVNFASADGTLTSFSWWTTLDAGSLPHNHHKPQLAGYGLGGAQ